MGTPLDNAHLKRPGTIAMRVFLTGGTGLIGRELTKRLGDRGDQPVILSRQADKVRRDPGLRGVQVIQGDPTAPGGWDSAVDGCDAAINLAGHNLFDGRWNAEVKRTIRDSRVYGTENLVGAIARASIKPKVLVQASAIGYYGPTGDGELTESSPPGSDFMARVCREWEDAAAPVTNAGVRLATVRTGVVLAKGASALGVMTPLFKWLPGGAAPVGSGKSPFLPGSGQQWMSWIHLEDIVGLFLMALDRPEAEGPINGTAPKPVRNAEFSKALARVVHRPMLPFGPPDLMLSLVLGEVADVVTKGQRVLPAKAESLGYAFRHPEINEALRSLFAKAKAAPKAEPAKAGAIH